MKPYILAFFIMTLSAVQAVAGNVEKIYAKAQKAAAAKDYSLAISEYSKLKGLYDTNKDNADFVKILFEGGDLCYDANRYIEALDFYVKCLEASHQAKNPQMEVSCTGNIGMIYAMFGDYGKANIYYEKGFEASKKLNDDEIIARFIVSLVMTNCYLGNKDRAQQYFLMQEQFPIKSKVERGYYNIFNQGLLALCKKDYHAALYMLNQAANYARANEMPIDFEMMARGEIGKIYVKQKKNEQAIQLFEEYKRTVNGLERPDLMVNALETLGYLYRETGDHTREMQNLSQVKVIYDSLYNPAQLGNVTNKLRTYEDKMSELTISDLNSRYNMALIVIAVILTLFVIAVCLSLVVLRQKKKLEDSYRLLIENNEQLNQANMQSEELRERYLQAKSVTREEIIEEDENPKENSSNGYNLREDVKEELLKKLCLSMENDEVISQPELNLETLAREIGTNVKYLSVVINGTYHKNFKTLLNEYRLKAACKLLKNTEKKIQSIAFETGYNSANTFIKVFKEKFGMTPGTYRRIARQQTMERLQEAEASRLSVTAGYQ